MFSAATKVFMYDADNFKGRGLPISARYGKDCRYALALYVDGEKVLLANPRINGWTHCNPVICFRGKEKKTYHVEVRMQPGDEDKDFTILGFGYVED